MPLCVIVFPPNFEDANWQTKIDDYLAFVKRTAAIDDEADGETDKVLEPADDYLKRSRRQLPTDSLMTLTADPQGEFLGLSSSVQSGTRTSCQVTSSHTLLVLLDEVMNVVLLFSFFKVAFSGISRELPCGEIMELRNLPAVENVIPKRCRYCFDMVSTSELSLYLPGSNFNFPRFTVDLGLQSICIC